MNEEWVSLSTIARELDIADSTARRWASMFSDFLEAKGRGAGRRFNPQARDVLRRVQQLYDKNLTADQIADTLRQEFSVVVDVQSEDERTPSNVPAVKTEEVLHMMAQAMAEQQRRLVNELRIQLSDTLSALRNEIAATREENEKLRTMLDERLNESEQRLQQRDKMLLDTLQTMNERANEKKSWWQRLMGK
ncbi:MerR family transcriptional regulator [Alicyclobacillus pomorum]|uniref:MerR family transcriptional regulator n=1 Tax=Alicyclobacillus pomorum TaxID=204470 RepID=UPI000410A1BA|nr:MerR family transcriptional regulator [Alicyclobacillus pomorum]